jgi:molybdate transport system ATP-binding protein
MSLSVDIRARREGFTVEAAFEASPGQTVALLGPNGAGKSTIVEALAGLLEPETGRVELEGEVLDDAETSEHLPPERRSVGVVFQDLSLFPHLSVLDNVAFPLQARGVPKAEARSLAAALLDRLGARELANVQPRTLSGGEAQRVALARALIAEPRMLLLDEPLSALDIRARSTMRMVLQRELARFPGVRLIITHEPVEAMTLADRVVVLEHGRVTQAGTPEEIRAAPRTTYAADLVGLNSFEGRLERLADGAGRISTTAGEVIVAWPSELADETVEVIGLLRPADVSLHTTQPEGGSARNVTRGPVVAVVVEGERARVRLESEPPLLADVTTGSLERLGIVTGAEMWASFKAVEVQVLAR